MSGPAQKMAAPGMLIVFAIFIDQQAEDASDFDRIAMHIEYSGNLMLHSKSLMRARR